MTVHSTTPVLSDAGPSAAPGSHVKLALAAAALCLGYFALANLSLLFVADPMGVAAIWPANGLLLGALIVARRRSWPVLLVAALTGNVAANLIADRWFAFALVDIVESLLAVGALGLMFRRPIRFARVHEVIGFAIVACGGAATVAGLAGALVAVRSGAPSLWDAWFLWAVVDSVGLLVVTPVVVTFATWRPVRPGTGRLVEALVILALFATACWSVFYSPGGLSAKRPLVLDFPYVTILPFLLWAGLRFDPRLAALLSLMLVTISAAATVSGHGPMARAGVHIYESIITVQFFGMMWALSALTLATITAERRAAADALAESERRARQAEGAAIENHARLQALFDHTSALISSKDRDGRYLQVNRAFEELMGKPAAEMIGKTDHEMFPANVADVARARDLDVLTRGQPIEYESTATWDQKTRSYQMTKFPVRDADGRVIAVCVVATDISRRKRDEEELRTAKEQAEAANRAKSEFLANISHEIRTPLTSILGYAELLLAPNIAAEERIDQVQTIRRNSEHLLAILNDVLDMSKIEAGRMTVEHVPCSVPQVVSDVLSFLRQRALTKFLDLRVACRTPVPAVISSDPTRLRQILLNIVGNAIKFTEGGHVMVELSLDKSHRAAELVIDVTDTGIGMTPEQVAALGQPFSQADPSHARRFGGSGLGMSICYRLAALMGGSITCQSQLNAGTTFTLRLPAGEIGDGPTVTSLDEVYGGATETAGNGEPSPANRLRARVLVAEDAPDTRRLLLLHLRRAGADAEYAENGQVAVARAIGAIRMGRPYDLILMDVQMPQMDGVTATGVLRSHGYAGRIVALTANAMEQERQRCLTAGFDDFLTKPIRGEALLEAVRRQLSLERPQADHHLASDHEPTVRRNGEPTIAATAPSVATAPSTVAAPSFVQSPAAHRSAPLITIDVASPHPRRLTSEMAGDADVGPLLPEYLHELRGKAASIERALLMRNWPELARLAHQIKGSAGGYGYPTITAAAEALETAAKSKDPETAAPPAAEPLLELCGLATRVEG